MKQSDSFHLSIKKQSIYGQYWLAKKAKANIILSHGLAEHVQRYQHVAEFLNENNYNLFGIDFVGHGQSTGKRGDVNSIEEYLFQIDALIQKSKEIAPNLPTFLYGHSMGGGIVCRYILSRDCAHLKGALLTSPWLRLAVVPPKLKVFAGKTLLKVGINITEKADLDVNLLSRNLDVGKAYAEDPLVHNQISSRNFMTMVNSGEWCLKHVDQLSIPVLVIHGTADEITDAKASELFASTSGQLSQWKSWENLRHETHNETNWAEVLTYNVSWFDKILSQD